MFHLIFATPCLYVLLRTLWPLALPLWAKGGVAVLLLAASQFHYWSKLSSGSVFAPEFPRAMVVLFNWAFGAIVLLFALQLLLDLGLLVAQLVRRGATLPDGARYAAAGLAALLAAIGVAKAMRQPPVRDITVEIAGLPPRFDGYRLLQLSDLHLSKLFPARWAEAMVARANAAGVDLIVVTGDFIDGSVAMRRADVTPLATLRAPDGVWAVPGNHEYFFDYDAWMRHLAGLGVRLLPNAHTIVERGGERLVLAGVTDASAAHSGHPAPDLGAALAGAPAGAPVVLLDHQPRHARAAAARGVALQLSGHTHGGMIVGLDRLVARGNDGFVSRRYQVGAMTLYVSNGTALWPGFALRLGRPSEMTRITLRRAG
ncbi:metallophosphoesterase [Sphingomonas yunnanensis]|nr:metallophosphoesterase [Sphingomonas yunnanensis]